ncbi:MAG: flagellar assembly peptidoglycan hydrolase FlgJ [Gammaproteobacteria bacterium]|nr:flagellar assembly peptidoglycan hydrolase FlgJ [Gammaproteobacteria bacterium]
MSQIQHTALDFKGLAELRRSATVDQKDQDTLRQVAGQFESLFVNMMLKSMRQAKLADGIFDSSQSDTFREMADQQLAMDLSSRGGIGLQEVIMRQLGGQLDSKLATKPTLGDEPPFYGIDTAKIRPALASKANVDLLQHSSTHSPSPIASSPTVEQPSDMSFDSPQQFVEKLWPMAKRAADRIGVTPDVILSQAALETGWGKHVINKANGESSFNLFNIKADSRWTGDKTSVGTVEYHNGVAIRQQAQFRSYDSYQQSFDDYVNFLQTQPRYQNALKQTDNPEQFIEALHKSGYATDPDYADKIKRIMNGATLAQFSQQLNYS